MHERLYRLSRGRKSGSNGCVQQQQQLLLLNFYSIWRVREDKDPRRLPSPFPPSRFDASRALRGVSDRKAPSGKHGNLCADGWGNTFPLEQSGIRRLLLWQHENGNFPGNKRKEKIKGDWEYDLDTRRPLDVDGFNSKRIKALRRRAIL